MEFSSKNGDSDSNIGSFNNDSEDDIDNVSLATLKSSKSRKKEVWHMRYTCSFCDWKGSTKAQLSNHAKNSHAKLLNICKIFVKPCCVLLKKLPLELPRPANVSVENDWVCMRKDYAHKMDFILPYCIYTKHLYSLDEDQTDLIPPDSKRPRYGDKHHIASYNTATRINTTPTIETEKLANTDLVTIEIDDDVIEPPEKCIPIENMKTDYVSRESTGPDPSPKKSTKSSTESSKGTNSTDGKEAVSRKTNFLKPQEISAIVSACFRKLTGNEKLLIYNDVYNSGKSFNSKFLSLIQKQSIKVMWTPNNKSSKAPLLCKRFKTPAKRSMMEGLQIYQPDLQYASGGIPPSQLLLNLTPSSVQSPPNGQTVAERMEVTQSNKNGSTQNNFVKDKQYPSNTGDTFLRASDSNVESNNTQVQQSSTLQNLLISDVSRPKIVSTFSLSPPVLSGNNDLDSFQQNTSANSSAGLKPMPMIKCKPTQLLMPSPSKTVNRDYTQPRLPSEPTNSAVLSYNQNLDQNFVSIPNMDVPLSLFGNNAVPPPLAVNHNYRANDFENEITTHHLLSSKPPVPLQPQPSFANYQSVHQSLKVVSLPMAPDRNSVIMSTTEPMHPVQNRFFEEGPFSRLKQMLNAEDVELRMMQEFVNALHEQNPQQAKEPTLQILVKFKIILSKFNEIRTDQPYFVILYLNSSGGFVLSVKNVTTAQAVNPVQWPIKYQLQLIKAFQQKLVLNTISVMAGTTPSNLPRKTNCFLKIISEFKS